MVPIVIYLLLLEDALEKDRSESNSWSLIMLPELVVSKQGLLVIGVKLQD